MIKIGPKSLMINLFFAYVSIFPGWNHWFLFKILAITVSSVSTEPFIVSESIVTRLKAKLVSSYFKISKNYGFISIYFLMT